MPILFFILLIVLIAQFGFWGTLSAILGAFAMLFLLGLIILAIVVLGLMIAYRRLR